MQNKNESLKNKARGTGRQQIINKEGPPINLHDEPEAPRIRGKIQKMAMGNTEQMNPDKMDKDKMKQGKKEGTPGPMNPGQQNPGKTQTDR